METKRKRVLIICSLAIVLLLVACVSCCMLDNQSQFDGSKVHNPGLYHLDFTSMDQTDAFAMSFKEGDRVHVCYEISKGNVDLLIAMEGERPAFRGNAITEGDFNVVIEKTGTYTITVQAKRAAGEVLVELK